MNQTSVVPAFDAVKNISEASFILPLPEGVREKILAFARAAAKGGRAKKTFKALISDGRIFSEWCAAQGKHWMPAAPETVADFIEAMAATGRKPATISRYLSSISTWHEAAGLMSPTSHILVDMARSAHVRVVGSEQRQAAPIGEKELQLIVKALQEDALDADIDYRLRALRDLALILVAYDTMARAAELVAFQRDDLLVAPEGEGILRMRRSKTDQEGKGKSKPLAAETVQAVLAWLAALDAELERRAANEDRRIAELLAWRRRPLKGRGRPRKKVQPDPVRLVWEKSPYIFRGLAPQYDPSGIVPAKGWSDQLTPKSVSEIFKNRMIEVGLDNREISAHSTRVGRCQDMLADDVDLYGAMQAGAWASPRMPARYGENILAARSAGAVQRRQKRFTG